MKKGYTIKGILLSNNNWVKFAIKYKNRIRPSIFSTINKLLSCRENTRGYHQYSCSNPKCSFTKKIPHTCKTKACSSCGRKATEIWIEKTNRTLPNTAWQHITFTMPCQLWGFFWCNRFLLNYIAMIAANCVKRIADKKGVIPGIFIAIHTFGRALNRNVHIHLSTTVGGVSKDLTKFHKLYFDHQVLKNMWKYGIIDLFRKAAKTDGFVITPEVNRLLNHTYTFNHFLDDLSKQKWVVHCNQSSDNHDKIVGYLGRYVKRPAIAESKLRHYDGHSVVFRHLNHKTKKYCNLTLSIEEFIGNFIQHIPDKGFRMIRYYGFLANRLSGKLLDVIYKLLGQTKKAGELLTHFADMIKKYFGYDPLSCSVCKYPLLLRFIYFGRASCFFNFSRNS
jgi:hypothetical protein